jgi:hypothetical protein
VRRGDLPALKLGGRGQWRIERAKLEAYIEQTYRDTALGLQKDKEADDEPDDLVDETPGDGGYQETRTTARRKAARADSHLSGDTPSHYRRSTGDLERRRTPH